MDENIKTPVYFLTVVNSSQEESQARMMIKSLRSFGGKLHNCSFLVFVPHGAKVASFFDLGNVEQIPLEMEPPFRGYELADKVFACARAEELLGADVGSLVWLNLDCLIVNPPLLFDLGSAFDVALRPVHIRNIGSLANESLDEYWKTVYRSIGMDDVSYTVESFVDLQVLRPYFNTHCFAIKPKLELMQVWREHFKSMVTNQEFQTGPCQDELHRLFLHQVVLSALISKSLNQSKIRHLPCEYSYPFHLQQKIELSRRIQGLNDVVCAVYEDTNPLKDIDVREPLKSWLREHQVPK